MKRSAVVGIAAGSALAAVAVTGLAATATGIAQQAIVEQHNATPTDRSLTGPYGSTRSMNVTDEPGYLARMVAHDQEAVTAARQLRRSDRPEMRALGTAIIDRQGADLAATRAWLGKWYPGRSGTATGYQPMIRDLSGLSGDALDNAFLLDMIPHHMAAVTMSQQLLMSGRAQHSETADFAIRVRDARHAEMFRMQRYLAHWFKGWSMPCGMRK
ncbi:DUF305 domain-containing protein [Nonomuraea angiospora]|uniref:Uncharacterized protein (DUF305 family) n=1 Tax=Nonomuraea angiospora TaxID=46172 RepID=A0ABR9LSD8_9ACTN|nr:DUF305 domain-containing protein [Nonomuraea angiospora]MBE1583574.1 uncharacterized protein (DUF305 family) [Nonomuraea angiospora]